MTGPAQPIENSGPDRAKLCFFILVFLLSLGIRLPQLIELWKPSSETLRDFVQEWVSAKNYFAGFPVYEDLRTGIVRHIGPEWEGGKAFITVNAHPPVSVLMALPFAVFDDYYLAHSCWNLLTLPLFVLAIALVLRELRFAWHWWTIFPAISLLLWFEPLHRNIQQAQINLPMATLVMLGWYFTRRNQQIAAGLVLGTATAMKLFPGMFLVYFLVTGRWRAALGMTVAGVAWNLLAMGVFGIDQYMTYVNTVVPSLKIFNHVVYNVSLMNFLYHVFCSLGLSGSAETLTLLTRISLFIAAIWWSWRYPHDVDHTFSIIVIAMLLITPIAWNHNLVFLCLPFIILADKIPFLLHMSLYATISLPPAILTIWLFGEDAVKQVDIDQTYVPPYGWLVVCHFIVAMVIMLGLCVRELKAAPTVESPASEPQP